MRQMWCTWVCSLQHGHTVYKVRCQFSKLSFFLLKLDLSVDGSFVFDGRRGQSLNFKEGSKRLHGYSMLWPVMLTVTLNPEP